MKLPITETHPQIAAEWHPTFNVDLRVSSVTAGVAKKAWWLGRECGHVWESVINSRTKQGQGCPYCAGKRVLKGFNDLLTKHPSVAAEWHPTKNEGKQPDSVGAGSGAKAWWLGSECGHEWYAQIKDRVAKNTGCPVCIGRLIIQGVNDLATTHPELTKLWDYDKNGLDIPQNVVAGSKKKIHWKCPSGHEFVRTLAEQSIKKSGYCFLCSPKALIPGVNDFATLHPEMAAQWHPTKNSVQPSEVSPESHTKVWWLGDCGHHWKAAIRNRAFKKTRCPYCVNQKLLAGFNDMATLRPDMAVEWHPTKNEGLTPQDIMPGANKSIWWLCSSGHEWNTSVSSRSFGGYGCPHCNASTYVSKPEQEIADFITGLGLKVRQSDRTLLTGSGFSAKEIDILVPEKMIAIEFNGIYWHSEKFKGAKYHYEKLMAVENCGYQLIQIWEDEWKKNPQLIKNMISHKMGVSIGGRVFARKTAVEILGADAARDFLEKNHIQGFASGSYYYGLKDDSGLVAVLVLKKEPTEDKLNIIRYATSATVVGGFTKLLAYVERNHEVKEFITFSDHCISDGGLYENNGFVVDKELAPDYRYVVGNQRKHKFQYRLKRFREDPDLKWQEGLSERELAELNGLVRIWDAGKTRWSKVL